MQEEAQWLRRRGGGEAEAAREDAPGLRKERLLEGEHGRHAKL